MRIKDFNYSKVIRVWINAPSTLQPYHDLHGKVGIAMLRKDKVFVYFTEGPLFSLSVDPMYLAVHRSMPRGDNEFEIP